VLERRIASAGFGYYASPLLARIGVPHAFSTRMGGTSPPPFDSFNLGNPSGCELQDDYASIYHHFDQLQSAVGCGDRKRLWVHQVHGGNVICVRPGDGFESGPKADALVSDDPARTLSVRVADCVPVLLSSGDGRIVAAIHSGWRGVIAGVVPNALEVLRALSPALAAGSFADAKDKCSAVNGGLTAAIGPSIGFDAFEVGSEVVEQFERKFDSSLVRRRDDGKGHVDLRGAIFRQLLDAGIPPHRIDTTDRCTFTDADEFFSHRRDKGVTGRMAAIISPIGS